MSEHMSAQTAGDILLQAEKISSLIATARSLMNEGKSVDLAILEGKVRTLCENAEAADLQDAGATLAALQAIVADLGLLDDEINRRHSDAGGHSLETSIKRAIDAYDKDNDES